MKGAMMMRRVFNGIDLIDGAKSILRGNRIGLLSAASGVNKQGEATYSILREKFELVALYSPEHGIRSNLQDGGWEADRIDPETALPIYNVGVNDAARLDAMLEGIDVLVYDIQDVGARFYTYLYNLSDMMVRCAILKKPIVILDRINPIGGTVIEGPRLDESSCASGIGRFNLPTRYALTVGEYARWLNAKKKLGCELHVVKLEGWERSLYADETDLLFVNPSPNIPSVNAAINYVGTCIFEATNLSEGRGTTRPFDLVGAPYVDSEALVSHLRSKHIDGLIARRAAFTPVFNKHAGKVCEGVELHITDRAAYCPLYAALCILEHVRQYPEFEASCGGLALRYGTNEINTVHSPETLVSKAVSEYPRYRREISPYLLY